MKTKLLSALTIGAMVFLMSCKGKDGAMGPAGPSGSTSQTQNYTSKEGFVKATATGVNLDGSTFTYNLDFEGIYGADDNNYKYKSPTQTTISIFKIYSGEGDAFVSGYISVGFDVPDMNSLGSPVNPYFSIYTTKDIGNNKFQSIGHSDYSSTIVSNLNYNSSTGILTGNYSISIPSNSYSGSLNITNGTFSTKLSSVVARMAAQ